MRLTYVTVAWLAGISAADWLWGHNLLGCAMPAWWVWAAVLGGTLLLLIVARQQPPLQNAGLLALLALLGALRYQTQPLTPCFGPTDVAYYNGSEENPRRVTLQGVIDREPDVRDRSVQYRVAAEWLQVGEESLPVHGLVLVQAPRYPVLAYGDRVSLAGLLQTPPQLEDFDYQAYLARKGVHALLRRARVERLASGQGSPVWAALYALRGRGTAVLARMLPEPAAGLAQGILLGVDNGIATDLYERFNLTGTSHVIVISGSNISLVAALLAGSAGRLLGKRRAVWLVLGGLTFYVFLVGADAAVVRAGLMGALAVLALHLGRQSQALTSLAAAVLLMTLLNPLDLWNVGFQLSTMATLGLILFATPLQRAVSTRLEARLPAARARQAVGLLNDAVLITLAANVTTLPLILYTFHRLPTISLLTNMLILPVQPPIMLWGGAALLLGLVEPLLPLARLVALVPWLCLNFTVAVVRWTSELPGASLELPQFGAGWLWASYGMIFAVYGWQQQTRGRRRRLLLDLVEHLPAKATVSVLLVATVVTWLAVGQLPDGRLHVTFLNVGQGDAILIETPSGNTVLVDGGPSPSALFSGLGQALPFWERRLDVVVSTHTDADHLEGLIPLFERYRVEHVVVNGFEATTQSFQQWQENLVAARVDTIRGQTGGRIDLGDGVWLDILSPDATLFAGTTADSNNNSVIARLRYGRFSVLLPGDEEAVVEASLLRKGSPLQATILKVPHHGSLTSSSEPFLAAVRPQLAVIEVGADNQFGHPKEEILARYQAMGIPILRTDQQGTIEISSDGARFWVQTAR